MLSPPLSALLDNEIKACSINAIPQTLEQILILLVSYLGHKRSSAFGPTYAPMTSKTQTTSE